MAPKSWLNIEPPLLNSACPWSTTLKDLKDLYECPYTGAVTTRTSLLQGFTHNNVTHQHIFFRSGQAIDPATMVADSVVADTDNSSAMTKRSIPNSALATPGISSLNTYGYSSITLSEYLAFIDEIVGHHRQGTSPPSSTTEKPFILSVTGTSGEVSSAYALVAAAAEKDGHLRLAMEINLSCPNIHGKPPPAYEREGLLEFLASVKNSVDSVRGRLSNEQSVPKVGVKLPPYTYRGQFEMVVQCLKEVVVERNGGDIEGKRSVIDFVTCTNTLGSSLVLDTLGQPALASESGTGLGGLAGAALHPLALGNVTQFRRLLDESPITADVLVIGVGGVEDHDGYARMRKAGAGAVACASALGRYGVGIFEKITDKT